MIKRKNASNSKDIKTYNRILVRNFIRKLGPVARYELARETGLTPPTVTIIVNKLIRDGIVLEVGHGQSSGGRRPVMLELNPKAAYIFAMRLQRDEVVAALFNLSGNILNHQKRLLDTSVPEELIEAAGKCFDWLIEDAGISREKVLCCGLASPGLINTQRGVIDHSSNLKWDNVPLGAMMSNRLYGIPVHVENISNAAALAEEEYGSGHGYRDLIYLNLSVGIGAGIIIDGEIYGGAKGFAGEIGHMVVKPYNGPKCACGRYGCLEALCGVTTIIKQVKEALPKSIFKSLGLNKDKIIMDDIITPSILGLNEVGEILEEAGKWVGLTLANLVSVFNPELIILGGELPKTGSKFVKTVVVEMNKHLLKQLVGSVKVVPSGMKEDPPLIGAYVLASDMLFSIEKWNLPKSG